MNFTLDWNEYKKRARALVASGCVLLKNDRQALPLHPERRFPFSAVFSLIILNTNREPVRADLSMRRTR